ncbi:hypothetical protein J3F84DRAFT_299567 [Trichoderma pleuroticola]
MPSPAVIRTRAISFPTLSPHVVFFFLLALGDTCSKPNRAFFLNQQPACTSQPTVKRRPFSDQLPPTTVMPTLWPCVFPRSARWRSTSSQDKKRISSLQDRSDATFVTQALTARLLVACSTAEWVM